MTWERRVAHLEDEHHRLNKKIDGLESTGVFDDSELTNLKKQRLNIKTELVKLKQDHLPNSHYNTEQND